MTEYRLNGRSIPMTIAVAAIKHNWINLRTRWGWFVEDNWIFLLAWPVLTWWGCEIFGGMTFYILCHIVIAYQVLKYLWQWRSAQKRLGTLVVIGVISVSMILVCKIGEYRCAKALNDVNRVVIGVETFRAQHGRLPRSLAEAGIPDSPLLRQLRLRYETRKDMLYIRVSDPFVGGKFFNYDLMTHTWSARNPLI